MSFKIKPTKDKEESTYKTLYIKVKLAEKIDKIAKEKNTSFNNVIISMIESCLTDETDEQSGKEDI